MIKSLRNSQKGFTLVEILIVVALIAILAVIALITINPAEAQKRSRDAQRLKEIGVLQGMMEQYISDNPSATGFTSESTDNAASNNCSTTGWIGVNLCSYANTLPKDPINRAATFALAGGTSSTGPVAYQILLDSNLRYKICTRLESVANATKLTTDGVSNSYFEVYSATDGPTCTF